jgi:hypothetical protein
VGNKRGLLDVTRVPICQAIYITIHVHEDTYKFMNSSYLSVPRRVSNVVGAQQGCPTGGAVGGGGTGRSVVGATGRSVVGNWTAGECKADEIRDTFAGISERNGQETRAIGHGRSDMK